MCTCVRVRMYACVCVLILAPIRLALDMVFRFTLFTVPVTRPMNLTKLIGHRSDD